MMSPRESRDDRSDTDRPFRKILREIRNDASQARYLASVMERIALPGFVVMPIGAPVDRSDLR